MYQSGFIKETAATFISGIINLIIGIGISVILARVLGPEQRGIYAMATLFPSLIVTFGNLGIGPATAYYVARGSFSRREILGNSVLLSWGIGGIGIIIGLVIVSFCREVIFPKVSEVYLLVAIILIPLEVFFSYVRYVLLGAQRIKDFNYVQVVQSVLTFIFILCALLGLKMGVTGAILAMALTFMLVNGLTYKIAKKISGGIDFHINSLYLRSTIKYGIKVHLSNVLGFLNYRVDMFILNWFLGPSSVGLYAVGVSLVEKLWMVSQAASTVIFPRVAAETKNDKLRDFTPLVVKTVLWISVLGAMILALFSRRIVLLLYSKDFLPSVSALQALLVGTIALSAGRVLANDIAGRGFPSLNIYTGIVAVLINIILNLLFIPRYEIVGAAWASTVSYVVSFLGYLFFYCRVSGNKFTKVLFIQHSDLIIYKQKLNLFRESLSLRSKSTN